jgi:hypothetical protein
MAVQNNYEILELQDGASDDEVRRAYKKLALKYHPDKNQGDQDAAAQFQAISEAFQRLIRPEESKEIVATGPSTAVVAHYNSTSKSNKLYSPIEYEKYGRRQENTTLEPESLEGKNIALTFGYTDPRYMDDAYRSSVIDTIKDIQKKKSVVKTIDFTNLEINKPAAKQIIEEIVKLEIINQLETTFKFSETPEYRLEIESAIIDGKASQEYSSKANTLLVDLSALSKAFPRTKTLEIVNCKGLSEYEPGQYIRSGQDAGFDIKELKITSSDMSASQIIELVNACPHLRSLYLADLKLSDKDLKDILTACADRLDTIGLSGCNELTSNSLKIASQLCPRAKFLDIRDCNNIEKFPTGVKFPDLYALKMISFNITGKDLGNIAKSCPNLETLNLYGCEKLRDSKIPKFKLNKLEEIYLPELLPEESLQKISNACPALTDKSKKDNSLPNPITEQSFFAKIKSAISNFFSGISGIFRKKANINEAETNIAGEEDMAKAIVVHDQTQRGNGRATNTAKAPAPSANHEAMQHRSKAPSNNPTHPTSIPVVGGGHEHP